MACGTWSCRPRPLLSQLPEARNQHRPSDDLQKPLIEDTALGEDVPKSRPFLLDIAQHLADMTKTRLAKPMISDRGPERLETDGHAGEDTKQAGFHHRAPMGDATLNAHPDKGLDQPKAQQRSAAVSRPDR